MPVHYIKVRTITMCLERSECLLPLKWQTRLPISELTNKDCSVQRFIYFVTAISLSFLGAVFSPLNMVFSCHSNSKWCHVFWVNISSDWKGIRWVCSPSSFLLKLPRASSRSWLGKLQWKKEQTANSRRCILDLGHNETSDMFTPAARSVQCI